MTRSDLIDRLAARHPQFTITDVDVAVKALLEALATALAQGRRIEIRGFGSFGLNHQQTRQGRNPRTGQVVLVPAKRRPHFKAGKNLSERVGVRT
jgi:integration host factor subunit beta